MPDRARREKARFKYRWNVTQEEQERDLMGVRALLSDTPFTADRCRFEGITQSCIQVHWKHWQIGSLLRQDRTETSIIVWHAAHMQHGAVTQYAFTVSLDHAVAHILDHQRAKYPW